jgi:Survival protein SurE
MPIRLPRYRSMRILITNDDGIHAPGIEALKEIASAVTDDVWIVAPDLDNSASHSLTPTELLRVCELAQRRYGVKGTPTDCVIMGVRFLMKDKSGPGSIRHQPRPESRRRHRLFRPASRGDPGHAARHSLYDHEPRDRARDGR